MLNYWNFNIEMGKFRRKKIKFTTTTQSNFDLINPDCMASSIVIYKK